MISQCWRRSLVETIKNLDSWDRLTQEKKLEHYSNSTSLPKKIWNLSFIYRDIGSPHPSYMPAVRSVTQIQVPVILRMFTSHLFLYESSAMPSVSREGNIEKQENLTKTYPHIPLLTWYVSVFLWSSSSSSPHKIKRQIIHQPSLPQPPAVPHLSEFWSLAPVQISDHVSSELIKTPWNR